MPRRPPSPPLESEPPPDAGCVSPEAVMPSPLSPPSDELPTPASPPLLEASLALPSLLPLEASLPPAATSLVPPSALLPPSPGALPLSPALLPLSLAPVLELSVEALASVAPLPGGVGLHVLSADQPPDESA